MVAIQSGTPGVPASRPDQAGIRICLAEHCHFCSQIYKNIYDEAAHYYLQTLLLNPDATHCWIYLGVVLSSKRTPGVVI